MITKSTSEPVLIKSPVRRAADGRAAEYFRGVLRSLSWPDADALQALRVVGLTSCHAGEGVSTVAVQLAAAAADAIGEPVVLVDANLARPAVHRLTGVKQEPGAMDVLRGSVRLIEALQGTARHNLRVLAAGRRDGDVSPLYDSSGWHELLDGLRHEAALVVLDLPAAQETAAAARLGGLTDGLLLVVEAERVRWEVARRTKELLERADARLLGAVLNKRREYVPDWLYRTL